MGLLHFTALEREKLLHSFMRMHQTLMSSFYSRRFIQNFAWQVGQTVSHIRVCGLAQSTATARCWSRNAVYRQHSLPAEMAKTEKIQIIMTTHWNRTHYCRPLVKTGNSTVNFLNPLQSHVKLLLLQKKDGVKPRTNLIWLRYSHRFQTTNHWAHRKGGFYLHHAAHDCCQRR